MRQVSLLGKPASDAPLPQQVAWLMKAVDALATASRQEGSTLADPYTVTADGSMPVRSLDVATATATQVAEVLGTFLQDMQKRGSNQKPQGGA